MDARERHIAQTLYELKVGELYQHLGSTVAPLTGTYLTLECEVCRKQLATIQACVLKEPSERPTAGRARFTKRAPPLPEEQEAARPTVSTIVFLSSSSGSSLRSTMSGIPEDENESEQTADGNTAEGPADSVSSLDRCLNQSAFDTEPVKPCLASIVTDKPGGLQPPPASDATSTPGTLAPQAVSEHELGNAEPEQRSDEGGAQDEAKTTGARRNGRATRVTMVVSVKGDEDEEEAAFPRRRRGRRSTAMEGGISSRGSISSGASFCSNLAAERAHILGDSTAPTSRASHGVLLLCSQPMPRMRTRWFFMTASQGARAPRSQTTLRALAPTSPRPPHGAEPSLQREIQSYAAQEHREKSSMSYNVAYDQDATNELVAESPTSVAGSCNAPAAGMYPDAQKQIKKTRKRGKCSRKKAKKGSRNRKNHEQSSRNNRP